LNILIIVPYNVYEAKHGNAIRVRAMMETLLKNGNKISLLMYDLPNAGNLSEIAGVKIYMKQVKFRIPVMAALLRLFFRASTYDLLCAKMEPFAGFKELVKDIIHEDDIDIVQCENIWTVSPLIPVIAEIHKPIVVTTHDVWSDRFRQLYDYQKVPGVISRRLLRSISEIEARALKVCDFYICVSDEDRRRLLEMGTDPSKLGVIANGVDTKKIRPVGKVQWLARELKIGDEDMVLFFPGSEMFQNKKAVEDILRGVLPKLDSRFKIVFAGTICNHLAKLNLPDSVILAGYLDDLSPLYGLVDIVILPITIGSGTKLKTVEAMAAGKPIITTPLGAIGLENDDKEYIVIKEDIEAYPDTIVELTSDKDLRWIIGKRGREISLKYDWSILMGKYIDIYKAISLTSREKIQCLQYE